MSRKEMWWKLFRAAILTISDKSYVGKRVDESGPMLAGMLRETGYEVVIQEILPDERAMISARLEAICDGGLAELVVTTGGTGFSPRDITPEATLDVAERQAPGIAEAMRMGSLDKTPRAMLSRGVCVLRCRTLILNLPGSPKGALENLAEVLPTLEHGLAILTGREGECGISHL